MKKSRRYYFVIAALFVMALLPVSCIKDNFTAGENASVTMTFTTRVGSDTQVSGDDLATNKRMKSLRVIVARTSTKEVLYNVKYDTFDEGDNGQLYKTITFSELTTNKGGEDFDFYAIANEEAFGGLPDGKDIKLEDLDNKAINLTNGDSYDKPLLITDKGIPQAKKMTMNISSTSSETVDMQLEFAVAKVDLTFHNTTNAQQEITDLRFTDIMPASTTTSLFPPENVVVVGERDFNLESMPVEGQKTATKTFYIYESKASAAGYKLSAKWEAPEGKDFSLNLPEIKRGQNLKIDITLIKREGLKISWNVVPWNGEDTDVEFTSEFNGAFSGQLVKTGTVEGKEYILTAEGMDSQQRERYAQFKFVMTSPIGQNWVAHLSNPNDFEFVGDYTGVGVTQEEADENKGVVTLTVRPRRGFVSGELRTTQLYITVDGLEGSQLINNPVEGVVRPFPGENNYVELVQVSTADYDTNNNN